MAERADAGAGTRGRLGCGLAAVGGIAAVLGVGWWLGHRDQARKTPCERYVEVVRTALDNCHSGATQNRDHHLAICEAELDPTDACLERVRQLSRESCESLERGPAAYGPVCEKRR